MKRCRKILCIMLSLLIGLGMLPFVPAMDAQAAGGTPAAPINLSFNLSGTTLVLNWEGVSGATGYKVFRGSADGGPYSTTAATTSTNTCTISGLSPAQTYYYVVAALNGSLTSSNSTQVKVVTTPDTPSITTASCVINNTTPSIRLYWNSIARATSYKVKRIAASDSAGAGFSSLATNYLDNSVIHGETYTYVVSSIYSTAESGDSSPYTITFAPSTPTGFSATSANTTATLSWNASFGTVSYKITKTAASTGNVTIFDNITGLAYTDTALTPGETYTYQLVAQNTGGSMLPATQTITLRPAAPTGLSAAAVNRNVTLTWNSTPGAVNYTVKRSTSVSGPYTTIATGVSPANAGDTTVSYTDGNVINGMTYYYVVTASNLGGESGNSNQASVVISPDVPYNVTASATDTSVTIHWLAPVGAAKYNVKRKTSLTDPSFDTIASAITGTTYTDTNVQRGKTYYYVVSAYGAGSSASEGPDSAMVTAVLRPDTPQNLSGALDTSGKPKLTWNATTGATGYNIKRSVSATGIYDTIGSLITGTTFTDTTAISGTVYYYKISAVNAGGESAYSNYAMVGLNLDAPIGLSAISGNSQVSLSWLPVYGATKYKLKRKLSSDSTYTALATLGTLTSYLDTTAANGDTYDYVVCASRVDQNNQDQDSADSAKATVTLKPDAPVNLKVRTPGPPVELVWTSVHGANSYVVRRSEASDGTYNPIGTVMAPAATNTEVTFTDTDSILHNNKHYYYKVSAVNDAGESDKSDYADVNFIVSSLSGLEGEYYDNSDYTNLKLTRVDSTVNFDWGSGSPDPSVGADTFSVRWVGYIDVPVSDTYKFYSKSDDCISLTIDGTTLINITTPRGMPANDDVSTPIYLDTTRKHKIEIKYYENTGSAAVQMMTWSRAGNSNIKEPIPAARLTHGAVNFTKGADYSDSSTATAWFNPESPCNNVQLNYRINSAASGTSPIPAPSNGVWKGDIGGLTSGNQVDYSFTYTYNGVQYSTAYYPYRHIRTNGNGLLGEYFNNSDFTNLKMTRTDSAVDFNWGTASPDISIDPNSYSVRWSGEIVPKYSETYTFSTLSDDGLRLYIYDDGVLNPTPILDTWASVQTTEKSATIALVAGKSYKIKVEYFQSTGTSSAKLYWSSASQNKEIVPKSQLFSTPMDYTQGGTYLDLSRANIWFKSSNNYSSVDIYYSVNGGTQQTKTMTKNGGTWQFEVKGLKPGDQVVYQFKSSNPVLETPFFTYIHIESNGTGLMGQYFNNMDLTAPVLTRVDKTIDFNWGTGTPDPAVDLNTFSIRWTGYVEAVATDTYTFYTQSDDGIRLYVNDKLIIDNWKDHSSTLDTSLPIQLEAGEKYKIKLEYYENGGNSLARLFWSRSLSPAQTIIPQSQLYSSDMSIRQGIRYKGKTKAGAWFTSASTVDWVKLNFKVDKTSDPNAPITTVSMTPDSTGMFAYDIESGKDGVLLNYGSIVDYYFTYSINGLEAESVWYQYTHVGSGGTGLKGDYFSGINFDTYRFTRVDPTINFDWKNNLSPDPLYDASAPQPQDGVIGTTIYSVRWTGSIQPSESGLYYFKTVSDDGIRVWLNGKLIIDNWTLHAATPDYYTLSPEDMQVGQKYNIKVEFYENLGYSTAKLLWSTDGVNYVVVPQDQLFPPELSYKQEAVYINPKTAKIKFTPSSPLDAGSVTLNYKINSGAVVSVPMTLPDGSSTFEYSITKDTTRNNVDLQVGDIIEYNFVYNDSGMDMETPWYRYVHMNAKGTGLKGEYYTGINFNTQLFSRIDPTVNFDWSNNISPNPATGIGTDLYSVRWTGSIIPIETGNYYIKTQTDDGVRVWIDGVLLINRWNLHASTVDIQDTDSKQVHFEAGKRYNIKVEYFENYGYSVMKLLWCKDDGTGNSDPTKLKYEVIPQNQLYPPDTTFTQGAVYLSPTSGKIWFKTDITPDNVTLHCKLNGSTDPRDLKDVPMVKMNGLWTATLSKFPNNKVLKLKDTIDYYFTFNDGETLTDTLWFHYKHIGSGGNGLKGEYFSGTALNTLKMLRTDENINFDWGTGSPGGSVPSDSFSVRWTGFVQPLYSEYYTFYTTTDDGVKVWLDDVPIITWWSAQSAAEHSSAPIPLEAGKKYKIRIEYFENGGNASAKLLWSSNTKDDGTGTSGQEKEVIPQCQLFTPSIYSFTAQSHNVRTPDNEKFIIGDSVPMDIKVVAKDTVQDPVFDLDLKLISDANQADTNVYLKEVKAGVKPSVTVYINDEKMSDKNTPITYSVTYSAADHKLRVALAGKINPDDLIEIRYTAKVWAADNVLQMGVKKYLDKNNLSSKLKLYYQISWLTNGYYGKDTPDLPDDDKTALGATIQVEDPNILQ